MFLEDEGFILKDSCYVYSFKLMSIITLKELAESYHDEYCKVYEVSHQDEIVGYIPAYRLEQLKEDFLFLLHRSVLPFEYFESDNLSMYGMTNKKEFFAEAFANSQLSKPNELGDAMNVWLERKGLIK